ncbi:hypothetical protein [Streptomyces sp. NPDC002889]|uniref:hypothetical protein n=1 Tax=Streptomyces sp. NPDC002889 TaxID=3364669 RepID=UPI00368B9E37
MPDADRLGEIQQRVDQLNADRILAGSTWTASPVTERSSLPPVQAHVVEDILRTQHSVIRGSVGVFANELHADFAAAARDDVPFLLDQLRQRDAEIAELQSKLRIRERQLEDMDAGVIA